MKKKIVLALAFGLFGCTNLLAVDGYEVYKAKCSMCHLENISKADVVKNMGKLKAPPMVEVANQVKGNIVIADGDDDVHRHVVKLFIKDYIAHPELEKSMCNPMALERFGVMPSQEGKLTAEEIDAVADWIYDRYEGIKFK
ncbi:MAG: cytochrome c [Sulfurimonas sp.]|nr:cytochrome c [Sulfurimonas sp.]